MIMQKSELLDKLIAILCGERGIAVPSLSSAEKHNYFRALCNVREPIPASDEFLRLQDEYLSEYNRRRGITDADSLCFRNGIALWQGDITTLKADAIVNACNEKLLGCFVPLHSCIDNAVHSYAGVQMRVRCNELMQGGNESAGHVKVTSGYNLPSKYVFHTVGPQVIERVTQRDRQDLRNCYLSCISRAKQMGLRTLAFCCISTGVYGFPKEEAATVAVDAVRAFKGNVQVIFCVYDAQNKDIYERLLK